MSHLSPYRTGRRRKHRLSGFAFALMFSALISGCAERDSATEDTTSGAVTKPTPRELFIDDCASCHGVDGSGNGPLAAELRVAPANLRRLKQANKGQFPSLDVQRSIDGRAMPRAHGLPDMPVWGRDWIREGLSEPEMTARAILITSYIASIQD